MPRKSAIIVLVALSIACGCAGPSAQVSQIQSEKQELLAAVKVQKEEQEALRQKAASLEQRLDQSEKEIARLTGRKSTWEEGTRTASTKSCTVPKKDIGQAESASEKLPWRAPATIPTKSKPTTSPPIEPTKSGSTNTTQVTSSLRSLAQRDSRLQYDPATDTAHYQADISFEASGASLTAQGRKRLDDLASWLKAEQTKELRILVSGSGAGTQKPKDRELAAGRASAVVDYLGRHGINADRLAIVEPQKTLAETSGSPVQIRLADSSAAILGLVPKQPALRR
jgi:outer membrane protein OmpA-like peptidoglycan-associated protein